MEFLRVLGALFFPERCPYCDKLIEPCAIACDQCYDEVRRKHVPILGGVKGFRCVSTFVYDGRVRRIILRIKYHNRTALIPQIARLVAADIKEAYGDNAFDIITYVPMYKKDEKEREYNQSKLLAKSLSKLLAIPCRDILIKVKRTKKQHRLKYAERKTNLSGAFQLIDREPVIGQRILIVDDIVTSGQTLGNCCRVISRAKPSALCCATIASARNKYPESTII